MKYASQGFTNKNKLKESQSNFMESPEKDAATIESTGEYTCSPSKLM
jgi:hypothetical protein